MRAKVVTTPIDIYRTAHLLVGQHGDNALVYAALRADKLLDQGEMDGRAVWLRILDVISVLH